MRIRRVIPFILVALAALGVFSSVALAAAEGPGWQLFADTYPTYLVPGSASGTIGIDVFNIGARASNGPITVTDTLPQGVKAREAGQLIRPGGEANWGVSPEMEPGAWQCTGNGPGASPGVAGATVVTCTDTEGFQGGGGQPTFGPSTNFNSPQPPIGIAVEAGVEASGLVNHVSIAGGGALEPAATEDPVTISSKPAPAGLTRADAWFSNADGTVDRQAGSHPYTATFVFDVATALKGAEKEPYFPGGEIRDLETRVPPGFVGDLRNMPQCTRSQLLHGACPPASMVGRLKPITLLYVSAQSDVFNMVPPPGMPAELGFEYGVPVYITFGVQSGGDNSLVAHIGDISQRETFQAILTLWGVPQESSHNRWRYREGGCSQEEMTNRAAFPEGEVDYCLAPERPVVSPFLTLPVSCGGPQGFAFRELNSWQDLGARSEAAFLSHDAAGSPAGFTGCESLGFEPSITVSPDTARSDSAAGLSVEVRPPLGGLEEVNGLGSADIKNTVAVLPAGLVINPGQAAGLQACGPAEDALTTEAEKARGEENNAPAHCPGASRIGTALVKSPLIEGAEEKQLEGGIYVLQSNPPEVKLLVAVAADGVNLKLVGKASLCETTGEVLDGKTCEAPGQLITAFEETPQQPATLFKLSFEGGPHAAVDTPVRCGTYASNVDFTPWSTPSTPDYLTSSAFSLSEGAGGGACPSGALPFAPVLTAGTTGGQAGGFTGLSVLLARGDGQQRIQGLRGTMPPGVGGMISSVPLCPEPQAAQGACPSSSRIGHAVVQSGAGAYPLMVPQPGEPEAAIYLTGPYGGAPFGLSIVTPVIAGPFNLGTIVTRARIEVDPHTAQVTVVTDPLPQIVKGIPTDLRSIQAVIDRPGFIYNPTSCTPMEITGAATSAEGASSGLSTRFQVGGCRELPFTPSFKVSTQASTSKKQGASLDVKVGYPRGAQANIRSVAVSLPKQLPARLTTIQQACLAATFNANPANCPAGSNIGTATASTLVLASPVSGPAYLVSHGGAAFPDLVVILQGEGMTLDLVGSINIKHGVTSSAFTAVPDAPISSFELKLPEGPHSGLAAVVPAKAKGSLCGQTLTMPTTLTGQNGAVVKQNTKIAVTGCPKPKKAHKPKHKRRKKK